MIRILDDGHGIAADELALAVQRHATSKIATLADLAAITSLGFRGEALPSIGSVSRMRVASRREGAAAAMEIRVDGGEVSDIKPSAQPRGTLIEVRDLFSMYPHDENSCVLRAPSGVILPGLLSVWRWFGSMSRFGCVTVVECCLMRR